MTTTSAVSRRPSFLSLLNVWLAALAGVMLAGVVAGVIVLWQGLAVTNLTDLVPWGLWITIDLSSIAMAAGAFSLSAAVYLLGLKRLAPIAKTAVYVGFVAYSMAMLCLLLDIGRPDRFYKALLYWNTHSVLWEVTMCVMLYFGVLLLEVLPIVAGADWWLTRRFPKVAKQVVRLHNLAPVLAVAGLALSSLHQSSLGATYGVLKARPIWYRPDLSVLFMISAIAGGQALTLFVTMLANRLTPRARVDDSLVSRVAHFVGWVVLVYLYFRFWDALSMTYTYLPGRTEGLRWLTTGPFAFNFWVVEMLLGAVVPVIVLLNGRLRRIWWLRLAALALVALGVIAYRWDTNLVGQLVLLGYLPTDITARYTQYFPSLIELLSGAGIVAYGALAVTLGIRYLNVVDHSADAHGHAPAPAPAAPALAGAD